MASPFDVFRKEHAVKVYAPGGFVEGVVTEGQAYTTTIKCSVQRIGRNEAVELERRGKRVSDYRRIYTGSKLPIVGEPVRGVVQGLPSDDVLFDQATGFILDIEFEPAKPSKTPAARVQIDHTWYEVDTRITMQNDVINNYQYLLYRVIENV